MHGENDEALLTEIVLNKEGIPCLWIRRLNIVKMALLKTIQRSNAISIKITTIYRIDMPTSNSYGIAKRLQIEKNTLKKEGSYKTHTCLLKKKSLLKSDSNKTA